MQQIGIYLDFMHRTKVNLMPWAFSSSRREQNNEHGSDLILLVRWCSVPAEGGGASPCGASTGRRSTLSSTATRRAASTPPAPPRRDTHWRTRRARAAACPGASARYTILYAHPQTINTTIQDNYLGLYSNIKIPLCILKKNAAELP